MFNNVPTGEAVTSPSRTDNDDKYALINTDDL